MVVKPVWKYSLRAVALAYLACLLLAPVVFIFIKTFEHGFSTAWGFITTPAAVSAFWLSVLIAGVAVPLNTIFGVGTAMVLVRSKTRGRKILDALIDIPFIVSPVIIGLSLVLVYGIHGWFGSWFIDHGIPIIFNPLGMIIATVFVSLPFCVREVTPVLMEVGTEQEQAAATLGAGGWTTFWRITLPAIRPGIVAGALFGFVTSFGNLEMSLFLVGPGRTTLPIVVLQYLEWKIDPTIAAVSVVQILLIAVVMLITDRYVKLARVV